VSSYRLTRKADGDIKHIYYYTLTNFGHLQAEKYMEELFNCLTTLANNPFLARDYNIVKRGVRRFEHGSHSIYFRTSDSAVMILRILHQRMDPARHL